MKPLFKSLPPMASIITVLFLALRVTAQPFSFAHLTDTHIGGSTGVEDLESSVTDINGNPDVSFVVVTGDITEFGSMDELTEARRVLNKLNKPWYVVPGNHDSKWSESGCNDFVKVFGSEAFTFEKNGFLFVGTASGPNMRMAPGQVPREHMLYLDSIISHLKNPDQPVIYINHYPMDEALANSFEVVEKLKRVNIQAVLLGHGHSNKLYDFEGIPGVMGRSNLRAARPVGGYNIVTIQNDTMYYAEKSPGQEARKAWCKVALHKMRHLPAGPSRLRPDYGMNEANASVTKVWEIQEAFDIGSGMAASGNLCVYANTGGEIIARDIRSGKQIWKHKTGGKIYSTPAIEGNRVVCPSTDGEIRCLNLKNGKLMWSFPTGKPIVASPVIGGKTAFLGSSEGKFRALNLRNGQLLWQFDSVRNFVETTPLMYDGKLFFGSWGNAFYALEQPTGKLIWKREKYANRMLSPAAVWPVEGDGKIFIVAPDRRMTAMDSKTGKEIWDSGKYSCRESIGISADKSLVYVKNMTEGSVFAFDARCDTQRVVWECKAELGYEIAPTPIVESNELVFIPTTGGVIYAIDKVNRKVAWKFKLSYALVNPMFPLPDRQLLISTMDGKVFCLKYE